MDLTSEKESSVETETKTEVGVKDHDSELTTISHKQLMDEVKTELSVLISADSLLSDLPREITLEEVNSQIALEHGHAMTVFVRREDDEVLPIVITQFGTVRDLKNAIKRFMNLKMSREGAPRLISWRYIWKRYWLFFDGETLSEDNKSLKDYGIHNKAEVCFRKRLVKK